MLYAKCSLSYVEVISECECEGDEPVVLFIINSSIIRWCFSLVFRTNSKELNSQTFHKPIENMLKIPAQFLFLDLSFLIYHKLSDFFLFLLKSSFECSKEAFIYPVDLFEIFEWKLPLITHSIRMKSLMNE